MLQFYLNQSAINNQVEHYITTNGAPCHSRSRRLSPEKLLIAKKEFKNLEKLGIIRGSKSQWSSAIHRNHRGNIEYVEIIDY